MCSTMKTARYDEGVYVPLTAPFVSLVIAWRLAETTTTPLSPPELLEKEALL